MTWHKDENSLIVNISGYTIRAILANVKNAHDERDHFVTIQISNLELPFRSFRSKIEDEIVPYFSILENFSTHLIKSMLQKLDFQYQTRILVSLSLNLNFPKWYRLPVIF